MDKTMRILRAPLWCVLATAGFIMASLNQPDVKYIPLEGRLELPLDTKSNTKLTTVTLWKQLSSDQQNVVAEWVWSSSAEDKVYGTYEGRTELDKETRVIVIRNMTKEDNGVYFIVVDQKTGDKHYNVVVIKNVPKPSVRPPCSPQSANCSLVCEGNITDSGPVTYRWKKDEGEWMESGQNWTITNDEEWKKVEKVFCEMKNPVSVKQSDPSDNPFYIKEKVPKPSVGPPCSPQSANCSLVCEGNITDSGPGPGNTPRHRIIVGIIVALIILIGLVLGVRYRDASSLRNENEAIATSLYVLCEQVKGNKKQCQRLAQRVKGLEGLVGGIKQKGAGQISDDVKKDLRDLKETLQKSAEDVVKKYISDSFHEHVFKDYNDSSEFRSLNLGLNSAFNKLSKALQVDHGHKLHKMFNEDSQQAEDEADRKEDHEELKRIMDLIDPIVPIATSLYFLCEEVKGNKKQCQRLAQRVKGGLEELVQTIKQKGAGQKPDDVEKDLCDLKETLGSAEDVLKKYISDSFHEHVFKDYNENSEFRSLNSRLNDAFNKLSKALQVDHKMFNEASQQAEDEADRKEDHEELKRIMDLIDPISDKAASLSPLCKDAVRNKERRQRLVDRVKVLEERLGAIKLKGPGQNYADVEEALRDLKTTLESAEVSVFVEKYTSDRAPWDYGNEFVSLNKCLGNALNKLSSALPGYQNYEPFE